MPVEKISVFFATNRDSVARNKDFGERFHSDGPSFYRCGEAVVAYDSAKDEYRFESFAIERERAPDPVTGRGGLAGSSVMFKRIRDQLATEGREAIVLIHGFASPFKDSLERGAQLTREYTVARPTDVAGARVAAKRPVVIVFSWPSNGRTIPPWEYHSDREDAQQSGDAIARFFMRFWDFMNDPAGRDTDAEGRPVPCNARIHLVAHSMGNWALRAAVQSVKRFMAGRTVPKVFDNVFLMAADADNDALDSAEKLYPIVEMARAVHVYHATNDQALVISDVTKFNPDRLGSGGPYSFTDLPPTVVAVDCTEVSFTELAHARHQYYRLRPEVLADVRAVLSGVFSPDQVPRRVAVDPGRRYRIPLAQ
jgi:esterase/lipase superfamily enzyme